MLQLGPFVFSIATAAYQQFQRQTRQRWSSNPVVGDRPKYQFIGQGEDTITLNGMLYPELTGGAINIELLRQIAALGEEQIMTSGNGLILGWWLIDGVSETKTVFFSDGSARKISFNLTLKKVR